MRPRSADRGNSQTLGQGYGLRPSFKEVDWVYGDATERAWTWLTGVKYISALI
jgi:hypothetical protein